MYPMQAEFLDSQARYRAFCGGRGAGKTWVGAYDLLRRSRRGRLYGVYAPSYPMLRDSTLREFVERAEALHLMGALNRTEMRATLTNTSEVLFRSLDDPERARGPNLSGAWIDEASLVPRTAYDIIIACLRQAGEAGWLSATFTPKGRQHWTYEVFGDHQPDVDLFVSPTADNPFVSPEFVQSVRAQYTTTYAQQELDGLFIDVQGAMAQRQWFPIMEKMPGQAIMHVRAWDLAATKKEATGDDPDYTVGTLMSKTRVAGVEHYWIRHVVRARVGPGEAEKLVRQTAQADGRGVRIYIPQDPGQAGKWQVAAFVRMLPGFYVQSNPITGDKVTHAQPFLAQAQQGNVSLVRGDWVQPWLDEVCTFPVGGHDDQVDSAADGFHVLAKGMPRLAKSVAKWG